MKKNIIYTEDLSQFKFLTWNRPVDPKHVQELVKSMKKEYHTPTIVVNSNMGILDGQHRVSAAQELGYGIFFEMLPEGADEVAYVQSVNRNSKDWKLPEFEHYYVTLYEDSQDMRFKDYVFLQNLSRRHKLLTSTLLNLIAVIEERNIKEMMKQYETGEFKFNTHIELNNFLEDLELFNDFPRYKNLAFMKAYASLYFNSKEPFNQIKMEKQYAKLKYLLKDAVSLHQYQDVLINNIYGKASGVRIVFLGNITKRRDKFALR